MSDETRRVLDLVAQGKITVDEGQQLLGAINVPAADAPTSAAGADESERPKPKWLRIAIHKSGKEGRKDKDVNIRVPMAIVRSGMRLGALIPGLAGEQVQARMRERGLDIDFSKLDAAAIETVLKELGDTNIEIDDGKSQVRITAE
jgi:hypothetical protein